MRTFRQLLVIAIVTAVLLGCMIPTAAVSPTKTATSAQINEDNTIVPSPTAQSDGSSQSVPTKTPVGEITSPAPTGQSIQFTTRAGQLPEGVVLKTYQPAEYPVTLDGLPVNLPGLRNAGVIKNLTGDQQQFLSTNGFVVIPGGDKQFKDLRRSVSTVNGQPYYLTVDAAYHAMHVTFNDMLEALESEYFQAILSRLVESVSGKVDEYALASKGQPVMEDIELAQAYLAVALKLLEPGKRLDPAMEARIAPQIAQIMAYNGRENSALIPGFEDDYGAYRPVGHYAGKPELENYFRAMTWFGRVAFKFKDPANPAFKPSRAPLFITMGLREASIDGVPAYQVWASLYGITDFMVGPSDDPGPVELNALMEQVYSPALSAGDLVDESNWQIFVERTNELPAPKINSTFAMTSADQAGERDWRFIGQRFTPDGFIFQNLVFDKVGTVQQPRKFPSGLDVVAAFGSAPAWQALEAAGEPRYDRYTEQMQAVQKIVSGQPEAEWLNRFYTAWLYAFRPNTGQKGEGYPPYMRTSAWGYKDVNAMLGSWAELKHDTVLYAKMPEMLGGGGPPMSGPAPAYVEPNPNVFYRLAYAAQALVSYLKPQEEDWMNRGWSAAPADSGINFYNANAYIGHMEYLGNTLVALGDIASRELQGKPLTTEDFEILQSCLEYKECLDHGSYTENPPEQEPIPVIAAVSGAEDRVLQAGVGHLNRIYVAVPLEGKLQIAQGGVFSYYEFTQPRSDRLTDQAWRERLEKGQVDLPAWTENFLLAGGKPAEVLAFRVGDVYYVTKEGGDPPLNLRAGPSRSQAVLSKLATDTYLTIIDGPVENADGTWWKVKVDWGEVEAGWVLENQAWYARSHP